MTTINKEAALARAEEIRDETGDGLNTATRVGGLLVDMVDSTAFGTDAIAFGKSSLTSILVGTVHNLTAPGIEDANTLLLNLGAAGVIITGITETTGLAGRLLILQNTSYDHSVYLAHDQGSTVGNRFMLPTDYLEIRKHSSVLLQRSFDTWRPAFFEPRLERVLLGSQTSGDGRAPTGFVEIVAQQGIEISSGRAIHGQAANPGTGNAGEDIAVHGGVGDGAGKIGNIQTYGARVIGLSDPVDPQDAATKAYVDASGGSGGGAPATAEFLLGKTDAALTAGRVVTSTPSVTWDLTTAGQAKAAIPADGVSNTMLRNSAACSVIGRATNTVGDPADIFSGADNTVLCRTSGTLQWQTITTGMIGNAQVTNVKLAQVANGTIKGRATAGSGDVEDLNGTQATSLLNVFTSALKGLVPASAGGTTNFLRADGTFAVPAGGGGGGTPGGADTQVQFNDAGGFGGSSGLTYDKTASLLSILHARINGSLELLGFADHTLAGGGTTNDLDPVGIAGASVLRITVTGGFHTLTGIAAQPSGTVLIVENRLQAAAVIYLTNQDALSVAANRFSLPQNKSIVIPGGGSAILRYDGALARWVCDSHAPYAGAGLEYHATQNTIQRSALTGDVTAPAASGATTLVKASASFAFTGDITPTTLAADTDNWAPTSLSTAAIIRASTDASRTLTGLTGGSDGRVMFLQNVGTFPLVLQHEGPTSTAANRFALGGIDATLQPGQSCSLLYDSVASRWRMIGGGPESLATTLAIGNSTGPRDIEINAGQALVFKGDGLITTGGKSLDVAFATAAAGNGGAVNISAQDSTSGGGSGGDVNLVPGSPDGAGIAGAVRCSGALVRDVADPTSAQDAATKAYVDAHAGGGGGAAISTNPPVELGAVSAGKGTLASADDHVHPTTLTNRGVENVSLDLLPSGQTASASIATAGTQTATVAIDVSRVFQITAVVTVRDASENIVYTKSLLVLAYRKSTGGALIHHKQTILDPNSAVAGHAFDAAVSTNDVVFTYSNTTGGSLTASTIEGHISWDMP